MEVFFFWGGETTVGERHYIYIVVMEDGCNYHFVYLSLILDAYSEEIVGWSVGQTLDSD